MNNNDTSSDFDAESSRHTGTLTAEPATDLSTPSAEGSHDAKLADAAAAAAEGSGTVASVTVRPVAQEDFFAWYGLFAEYAAFYEETLTDDRAMRAWALLHREDYQVRGLVAVAESGEIVGIAHVRPFERPLEGDTGLYLDDLYVREDARGKGAGRALIAAVTEQAKTAGYGVVRWITAKDNTTARKLYDSVAEKTPWVTYDIALG